MNEHLVCIECFRSIKSIFKIYSDGFKDLSECVRLLPQLNFKIKLILS